MTREQEAMIVRKVLQGDVNAFERLVTEYEKAVYAIAQRMTGNAEDAADMTQETFIKAYNSLQSFRGDSKFSVCSTASQAMCVWTFCGDHGPASSDHPSGGRKRGGKENSRYRRGL